VPEQNKKSATALVNESIGTICDELKLIAFVRAGCNEFCDKVMSSQVDAITKPVANSVACAIVSIVHEDSRRKGRVKKHLPDRIVGHIFGLSSVAVVYNKRLINTVIAGDSSKLAHISHN
jgi:hypothetical protein